MVTLLGERSHRLDFTIDQLFVFHLSLLNAHHLVKLQCDIWHDDKHSMSHFAELSYAI